MTFSLCKRGIYLTLFISYSIAITIGSLLPNIGGSPVFALGDKILHLLGYGIFAVLGWLIVNSQAKFSMIALSIFIYGLLIEIAQIYTGRSFSVLDLIANGAGILIAYLLLFRRPFPTRS